MITTHSYDGVYWTATIGDWDEGDPIGSGLSAEEAIGDLLAQLEE